MEAKDIRSLADTWELDIPSGVSEEEILRILSRRIEILISREPETFFQIMYRLDIAEAKLNNALFDTNPPDAVARLIWERQWEKAHSRQQHKSSDVPDDELKW